MLRIDAPFDRELLAAELGGVLLPSAGSDESVLPATGDEPVLPVTNCKASLSDDVAGIGSVLAVAISAFRRGAATGWCR